MSDEERPRGYSLQEHVREAELDIIRESTKREQEIDQRDIRIDELETALRQIRELTGQDWPEETVGKIAEVVDEVLGTE